MVLLRAVIQVLVATIHDPLPRSPANRLGVRRMVVGGDPLGTGTVDTQQPAKKATGGIPVAMFTEQRIKEVAVAADRAIEVTLLDADLHIGLVEIPGHAAAATTLLAEAGLASRGSEARLPGADGLVGDGRGALPLRAN